MRVATTTSLEWGKNVYVNKPAKKVSVAGEETIVLWVSESLCLSCFEGTEVRVWWVQAGVWGIKKGTIEIIGSTKERSAKAAITNLPVLT